MRKYHKETKSCLICGKNFSQASEFGNPYKWCPQCREKKYSEFEEQNKKIRKNKR